MEITINGHKARALIDPWPINGDLILANFCYLNKIPIDDMDAQPLETAIKVSRSTMTKKTNVELNIQGNKISKSFSVSNLRNWYAILVQHFLANLNVIIDVKNNKVSIHPIGKPRHHLHMLRKHCHTVSTAACSIDDYNADISYNSSSHAEETDL